MAGGPAPPAASPPRSPSPAGSPAVTPGAIPGDLPAPGPTSLDAEASVRSSFVQTIPADDAELGLQTDGQASEAASTMPQSPMGSLPVMGKQSNAGDKLSEACKNEDAGDRVMGRWSDEEHRLFVKGFEQFGPDWKRISELVVTRTNVQVRTHAQKYVCTRQIPLSLPPTGVGVQMQAMFSPNGAHLFNATSASGLPAFPLWTAPYAASAGAAASIWPGAFLHAGSGAGAGNNQQRPMLSWPLFMMPHNFSGVPAPTLFPSVEAGVKATSLSGDGGAPSKLMRLSEASSR